MGIRIDAFAVDVDGFGPWLRRRVADVFFYIAQNVVGETTLPSVYEPARRRRYLITPRRRLRRVGPDEPPADLQLDEALGVPMLARPVADYLRGASSFELLFL